MADLSAFTITHYPVGQQRAIAAEFAELAAKVDDLHDDDALRWTTSNALDALLKARDAAVYAAWRADTWAMFKARREQDARQAEDAADAAVQPVIEVERMLSELKPGDRYRADNGYVCEVVEVFRDSLGNYVLTASTGIAGRDPLVFSPSLDCPVRVIA